MLSLGAQANDIDPAKETYTAPPAPNAIVLDGDLSEWSGVPGVENPGFSVPKGSGDGGDLVTHEVNGGEWTDLADHSATFHVTYDADSVYLGAVVTDDYHEHAANIAWEGDAAQIMIANGARDAQVALYNFAVGGVEGALGDLIINEEAGPGGVDAAITRDADAKTTTYEICFPMASLGLDSLAPGVQFGLGASVNDGDEATPGQSGWSGWGPHALVFGKSPEETALITLGGGGGLPDGAQPLDIAATGDGLTGHYQYLRPRPCSPAVSRNTERVTAPRARTTPIPVGLTLTFTTLSRPADSS